MKRIFSSIGSWGAVALAVFCPVCIPAIGAFLGSLGISVLALSSVIHPLLVVFLGLALLRLGLGYRRHRKPWPLLGGVLGGAGLYAGKWLVFSLPILYAGAALGYRFYPSLYEIYPSPYATAYLELNGQFARKSQTAGQSVADSGGHTLFLSPGVQFIPLGNLILEASLQIPVRQELNGTQLGTDFAFKGGIRWLIF